MTLQQHIKRYLHAALCLTLLTACDMTAQALPSPDSPARPAPSASPSAATPAAAQLTTRIRVRADAVAERDIAAELMATGVVQAFRKSVVAAEVGGRVAQRRIEPGQIVSANQVLIELDAERSQIDFARAGADATAREVDFRQAEHELRRGRRLIAQKVISQDTLDDLRFDLDRAQATLIAARSQRDSAARTLADSKIRAPFAGTAEIVHVQTGDFLTPGTPVVTVADFSRVRVIAGVTANVAAGLTPGDSALINIDGQTARKINGTIRSIGRISDSNGTFPLELWVEGEQAASLREGMVASVQLPRGSDTRFLSVPRAALLRRDGAMFVYIITPSADSDTGAFNSNAGIAQLRGVRLGRSDGQYSEVLDGVSAGEQVIIEGLFALRDGAPVELLE